MKVLREEPVTIDLCRPCDVVWLDHGELQSLSRAQAEKSRPGRITYARPTPARCPRCSESRLVFAQLHDASVLACPQCRGLLIDSAALDRSSGADPEPLSGEPATGAACDPIVGSAETLLTVLATLEL